MEHVRETIKHLDFTGAFGNITSLSLFGIGLSSIETGLRILCLVGSLVVGWVTYQHTQEKRRFLRDQKKESED